MVDLAIAYADTDVLITGGLGFIGSNLARRLLALGARVTIVDALLPGGGANLYNIDDILYMVELHVADVSDCDTINKLVKKRDFVFNLIGHVSHIDSLRNPGLDMHLNCHCHLCVLEACRNHNPASPILYAGTRGQYGRADRLPVTEDHPLRPIDPNGANKLAAEHYHMVYHRLHGLRTCSLRLTNTFGPRHTMKTSRQGFLNWFIRLAMDDEALSIYGDGAQLRDFNYVDDVVEAMLLALATEESSGRALNLGSGRPTSVLESAEAVVKACGSGRVEHVSFPTEKRAIEVGDYWADYSSFQSLTGWRPAVPFVEGLKRTIAFYREHGEHYWSGTDDSDV